MNKTMKDNTDITIHNTKYIKSSNNIYDILNGYNDKYKMKVTLLFPKP